MKFVILLFVCFVVAFSFAEKKGCEDRNGVCKKIKLDKSNCPSGNIKRLDCPRKKKCCLPPKKVRKNGVKRILNGKPKTKTNPRQIKLDKNIQSKQGVKKTKKKEKKDEKTVKKTKKKEDKDKKTVKKTKKKEEKDKKTVKKTKKKEEKDKKTVVRSGKKPAVQLRQKACGRTKNKCKQVKGKCVANDKCKAKKLQLTGKKFCSKSTTCTCCYRKNQACREKKKCTRQNGKCQFKWETCDGKKKKNFCKGSKKACVCCIPKTCTDPNSGCSAAGGECLLDSSKCDGEVDSSLCGGSCTCCIRGLVETFEGGPLDYDGNDGSEEFAGGASAADVGRPIQQCFAPCPVKPQGADCTEYFAGCCTEYICGDLPRVCPGSDGLMYEIGESWEDSRCTRCNCYYSASSGAQKSCYPSNYCPPPPHKDCVSLGKPDDRCCEQYNCIDTTCKYENRYYGIEEEWTSKKDPCVICQCKKEGNNSPEVVCEDKSKNCPAPPQESCRPLTYVDECCPYEWDCTNDYLITTTRNFVNGQKTPMCIFATSPDSSIDLIFKLQIKSEVVAQSSIQQSSGTASSYICGELDIPKETSRDGILSVTGTVGSTNVNEANAVRIWGISKTFVQTDKYLYLPGQLVQFRILTIIGSQGKISNENIPAVWIISPTGSRIAQWDNLENPDGLLQLDFQLADELEQGIYLIKVEASETEGIITQSFKVEDYVLPRFAVTLDVPSKLLRSAEEIPIKVCAKYTYGQDVKGAFTVTVSSYEWSTRPSGTTTESNPDTSGCWEVKIDTSLLSGDSERYYIYKLEVMASFTEEGTDIEEIVSQDIMLSTSKYSFSQIISQKYHMTGLPFHFMMEVSKPDGSSVIGDIMNICIESTCNDYTMEENGIIDLFFPSHLFKNAEQTTISVRPKDNENENGPLGDMYGSSSYISLPNYYSPSSSTLQLEVPIGSLECPSQNDKLSVPVFFVANGVDKASFVVQLLSGADIILTEVKEYDLLASEIPVETSKLFEPMQELNSNLVRGSFNLELAVENIYSSDANILLWYTRSDGEVVSTSGKLKFKNCLGNPTTLSWTTAETQPAPKDTATLTISANPKSVCGLGVVDRSVKMLSSDQKESLTVQNIISVLNKANVNYWGDVDDHEYCYGESNFYQYDYVFAEGIMEKRSSYPYYYERRYVDGIQAFIDAGVHVETDLTLETRPCIVSSNNYGEYVYGDIELASVDELAPAPGGSGGASGSGSAVDYDGGEEETAFETEEDSGNEIRSYFPETWLWQLIVLNDDGLQTEEVVLPDTITEWVGEAVCTHPDKGLGLSSYATITTFTPFFLDLTLPPIARRGENIPVLVSIFNYFEQKLPVTVTLQESSNYSSTTNIAQSCVDVSEKEVVEFIVTPSVVGEVNLTIIANIDQTNTQCNGDVSIEKSDTVIRPLRVKFEGVVEEIIKSDYICTGTNDSLETWSVATPTGIVPDSERIFISVTGDILGPSLDNLGNLIRMPYGCGEQNMLNFAPNIFILQYLRSSGQNTSEIEDKSKRYMISGYQRELTYQRDDGSFSAFGNSDNAGSTLLTAFVLKSFAQAAKYITVDGNALNRTSNWLLKQQQDDGCFELVGRLSHKSMLGGIDGKSLVPLTAYTLIALLESEQLSDTSPITAAMQCITDSDKREPYTNALKAYALALAKDDRAKALIDQVYTDLSTDTSISPKSILIETASYALLAMMKVDASSYVGQASQLAKLISENRNGQGGFVSTQDTIIALQCLAIFGETFPSLSSNLNVEFGVEDQSLPFVVNGQNRLLLQKEDIMPNPPFNVSRSLSGEGCVLTMLVQRFNVPDQTQSDAFDMTVTSTKTNCISSSMRICASYNLADGESNMAVFDIELETGYSAVTKSLRDLVKSKSIKRFEDNEGVISLYLDEITSTEICLDFEVTRNTKVDNVLPGTITLYDYYEPELRITKAVQVDKQGC